MTPDGPINPVSPRTIDKFYCPVPLHRARQPHGFHLIITGSTDFQAPLPPDYALLPYLTCHAGARKRWGKEGKERKEKKERLDR